jgi:nucleotide-binding universal stress UspA family protein
MFEYEVLGSSDVKPADVLSQMVHGGVRPIVAVSERFRSIRRVLIAYSGSVREAEAMKQFVRLQLWQDVTLRILACGTEQAGSESLLDEASAYCREHGYEVESSHRPGSPQQEILIEAAEWDADLIVLGMSRKSALSRAVFGTTALHVIRNADRPLFLGP